MATNLQMWQVAVFLFDMKGSFEVSVAGKTQFCQELGFCERACYVSSHHSVKPSKLRRLTPLFASIQSGGIDDVGLIFQKNCLGLQP